MMSRQLLFSGGFIKDEPASELRIHHVAFENFSMISKLAAFSTSAAVA
jgi:hypothetical protein